MDFSSIEGNDLRPTKVEPIEPREVRATGRNSIDKQSLIELIIDLHNDEKRQESYEELIRLLKDGRLTGLLVRQCAVSTAEPNDSSFLNLLVSLPQITANKYQILNDDLFRPTNYFKRLCSIIYETLCAVQ